MSPEALEVELSGHPRALAYLTTPDCNVCEALAPRVRALLARYPAWRWIHVDLGESPEVRGQLLVFSVPAVLLFAEGKELVRFARSFSLDELERALSRYGGG